MSDDDPRTSYSSDLDLMNKCISMLEDASIDHSYPNFTLLCKLRARLERLDMRERFAHGNSQHRDEYFMD